jgi:putative transcriptional regulator
MKEAEFQTLLQGIREAGAYLRGEKNAAARIDHIAPESVTPIRARKGQLKSTRGTSTD